LQKKQFCNTNATLYCDNPLSRIAIKWVIYMHKTLSQNTKQLKEIAFELDILIVEDELMIQNTLKLALSRFFRSIDIASDGKQALSMYGRKQYDLILTDLAMPYVGGVELSRKIKLLNEDQKIIVLSGYSDGEQLIELINIGIEGFLLKPLEIESLVKQLIKTCQSIYDAKMLEYLSSLLENSNKELEKKNKELQEKLSATEVTQATKVVEEEPLAKPVSITTASMTNSSCSLKYKMSALEFHDTYPLELDRTNENLEELEDRFHCVLTYAEKNMNQQALADLNTIVKEFALEIETIPQFSQLSYGIRQLEETFRSVDDPQKIKSIMPMIASLFDNLSCWRRSILEYRDAEDIHYMDDSIISDAQSLQGILNNTQTECSEMELF